MRQKTPVRRIAPGLSVRAAGYWTISPYFLPSPAISGHLRPSPAISGHLRPSPAISGHLRHLRPSPAISGATFGAGSQPKGSQPPTSLFFACRAVPANRDKAATKKCLHFIFPAMYAPIFGRPERLQACPVGRFIFRVSGHHRQIMPPAAAWSRARRLFGPPAMGIRRDATKPARGPEIGLSGDARFSGHWKSCGQITSQGARLLQPENRKALRAFLVLKFFLFVPKKISS